MSIVFIIDGILAIVYRTASIFGRYGRGIWEIVAGIIAFIFAIIAGVLYTTMLV